MMERVNICAPKSSTVAEHVRLLEKRATTGKALPSPTHHAHGRKKEARRRKRRGGRTALNPEVVAVAAEALVEASELGTVWAQFWPGQQFGQNWV